MLTASYGVNEVNGITFSVRDEERMEFYFTLYYEKDIKEFMESITKFINHPDELEIRDDGNEANIYIKRVNSYTTRIRFQHHNNKVHVSSSEFLDVCNKLLSLASRAIEDLQKINEVENQEKLTKIREKIDTIKKLFHGECLVYSSTENATYHVSQNGELTRVPILSIQEWKQANM